MDLNKMGQRAVSAKYELQKLSSEKKRHVLLAAAKELIADTEILLDRKSVV